MPSLHTLLEQVLVGLLTGGVYALMAAGLALIFGVMRIVHISHAAFLILAAYLAYLSHTVLRIDPLLSMAATVPLFFVVGIAVQRLLLARLRDNVGMMSVLLTFAIAITIEGGIGVVLTSSYRSIDVAYAQRSLNIAGFLLPYDKLIGSVVAGLTLVALFVLLRYSRYGRALRATIQHPAAAQLVGIDTQRVTAFGFGLGLATAAVGGTILGIITTFAPVSHYDWIARLMAIIVLGGLGSVHGALIAALAMGVAEGVFLSFPSIPPTYGAMVFYVALFATLIVRPQGIFGGRLAERY